MITLTLKLESPALDAIAQAIAGTRPGSHHQDHALAEVLAGLHNLAATMAANHKEALKFMAGITIQLDKLDSATTKVAAELKKLRDVLASGTAATPEEMARFDALVANLEAIGTDPNEPLPPVALP
jgi:hypothetical protein